MASSHSSQLSEIAKKLDTGEPLSGKVGRKGKKVRSSLSLQDALEDRSLEFPMNFISQDEVLKKWRFCILLFTFIIHVEMILLYRHF